MSTEPDEQQHSNSPNISLNDGGLSVHSGGSRFKS